MNHTLHETMRKLRKWKRRQHKRVKKLFRYVNTVTFFDTITHKCISGDEITITRITTHKKTVYSVSSIMKGTYGDFHARRWLKQIELLLSKIDV